MLGNGPHVLIAMEGGWRFIFFYVIKKNNKKNEVQKKPGICCGVGDQHLTTVDVLESMYGKEM